MGGIYTLLPAVDDATTQITKKTISDLSIPALVGATASMSYDHEDDDWSAYSDDEDDDNNRDDSFVSISDRDPLLGLVFVED